MTHRTVFAIACALAFASRAAGQEAARPSPQSEARWYTLSNVPNTQAYGRLNPNGYVVEITHTRPLADVAGPSGQAQAGDPYGFTGQQDGYGYGAILNNLRISRGLRPLAYSGALSQAAYSNSARGFGHNVGGYGRGQVVGFGSLGTVQTMWMADPPHARILLDPYATSYGIGGVGQVLTVNIN